MSFLPIVQRELCVSSRRKLTYYARSVVAAIGMVMSFFLLFISMLASGGRGSGSFTFSALSWYALITTLLAGVFLAADTLSEERREGTLGLLFLTDLKGYDVVLGKFMAVSLNAFYGLLAVFPVLAISMMSGGVTGAEFWRTCLALLNFLFFSVATSMLVSSFCTTSYRAMAGSIALLIIWLTATKIVSSFALSFVANLSPFESFLMASDADYFREPRAYWSSLAVSHFMGWLFLGWAAWRLRLFVDKGKSGGRWQRVFSRNLLAVSALRRARLLETNPVLWLLDDSRWMRWVAWVLSLGGVVVMLLVVNKTGPTVFFFIGYVMWPFYLLLKIFLAIQACRFFGEARRTGALELLCCTPLTMKAIVQGQWMLLRRLFLWPFIVLLSTHLAVLLYLSSKDILGGPWAAGSAPFSAFIFFYPFKAIPNNLADFFAIGWFGMWLASCMQRPNLAAGLTILSVVILPAIAYFLPIFLATDSIFIVIGWVKLSEDFRLLQAQRVATKPGTA
jgi:ABC-type transport system involved in multi-copper enzyme maturation permease subunit